MEAIAIGLEAIATNHLVEQGIFIDSLHRTSSVMHRTVASHDLLSL